MNKVDKNNIYNRLKKYLTPYFKSKGYELDDKLFSYKNSGFKVSWGAIAERGDWLTFQPRFRVDNIETIEIIKQVFSNEVVYFTSTRAQSTTHFAHELGVHDFDDSEFNYCSRGTCAYGYRICLDKEDAKVLEGIPILHDVEPIVNDHIAFLEKVAFPYFERLSTVKGINEYFNDRVLSLSEEIFIDTVQKEKTGDSFQKEEVLSAIVAAYLEKDIRYNTIIKQYQKLYSENDWYLDDINKLLNWINENPLKFV